VVSALLALRLFSLASRCSGMKKESPCFFLHGLILTTRQQAREFRISTGISVGESRQDETQRPRRSRSANESWKKCVNPLSNKLIETYPCWTTPGESATRLFCATRVFFHNVLSWQRVPSTNATRRSMRGIAKIEKRLFEKAFAGSVLARSAPFAERAGNARR